MTEVRLEILRNCCNCLWLSPKYGKTAAERLGPADGETREDHILGYEIRQAVKRLWNG